METKKIARYLLVLNIPISIGATLLTLFCKGPTDGFLAVLVYVWLNSGPFAYLRDWAIPLVGPFSFVAGSRQPARFVAVCVMVLMLWLLAVSEMWLALKLG